MRFTFFLLILYNLCLSMTNCCHSDMNPDNRARVNCTGMTLSTVPSVIDPATEVIVLADNGFVSLSWTSYQSFLKLHELDLSRNKVSSLENISDLILPSLRVLRLSGNRLQELPESAFAAASELMEIYLHANQLQTLNEDTFKNLKNLEVLDLSQNLIQVLPLSLLSVMTTKILKTFDVEDNHLKVMPNQFFSKLPDIPYVYLSKNPWVCDCEVLYLTTWLEDQGHNVYVHTGPSNIVNDPESVVCDSPSRLKDRVIIDLTGDEYCSPSGDLDSAPLTTAMTSCCLTDKNLHHRERVNCTGMTLSTVPSVIDPATEVIVLTDNEFVSLSWTSYQSFLKLHELDLSRNKVSSLENISDLILPSLRVLRLSGNRLQELPESAFAAASELMEIYLHANQLHTLNEDTFKNLKNLEVLDLSQNLIQVLPLSLLSVMTTKILKTFDVEGNHLKVMPNQLFSKLPDIPYVYLSKNLWVCDCEVLYLTTWLEDQGHNVYVHTGPSNIVNDPESVVCDSPSRLKDRVIIDLTGDEYCSPSGDLDSAPLTTAMTSCCHTDKNLHHRERVNCTGMTLSTVPSIIDPATEVIVLADNGFVSLSWTSYQSFLKLHELDLSRNKVSSLENISDLILPSLRVLRLSGNRLQELPESAFAAASELMEIYLHANQLHTLNEDTFKNLKNLEVLDLSQNLIQVLPLSLLSVMTTKILKTFDVEDNHLKVMPNQFFSKLPDIPYVYLSKNPWVCDCEVLYLTTWLEDQGHNVYVHTGPSNIVNDPESVVCDSPSRLKDRVIIDLTGDEYCSPSGDLDSAPLTTAISPTLSSGYVLQSTQTAAVTQTNTTMPTLT